MDKLQIFSDPVFGSVRTITGENKPLFCGVDVARPLGYARPGEAVKNNCRCTFIRRIPHPQNPEKEIEMIFITEGDVYRLIARSRLPEAEKFESWIFDEVLPSIRANGGYIAGQETLTDAELMAKAVLVAQKTIEARDARILSLESDNRALTESNAALTAEIAAFEPVKTYYEQILSSTGTLTTTQIAADYDLSAQKLNKILHEEGIQRKVNGQWILYAAYAGNGYTKSVTIPIVRANGTPDSKLHTQWTQKGRLMIHDLLTRRGVCANIDREAS